MITVMAGLKNSLLVLECLRNNEDLKDVDIQVGTFTNCRECGLTFIVNKGLKYFTYCVYEHRNSDAIIVNGKEGYVTVSGDLPYAADDKYIYLAEFEYGEAQKTADFLAEQFVKFNATVNA